MKRLIASILIIVSVLLSCNSSKKVGVYLFYVLDGDTPLFDEVFRVDSNGNMYCNRRLPVKNGIDVKYDLQMFPDDEPLKVLRLYLDYRECHSTMYKVYLSYKSKPGKVDTLTFGRGADVFYQGRNIGHFRGFVDFYRIDWKTDSIQ